MGKAQVNGWTDTGKKTSSAVRRGRFDRQIHDGIYAQAGTVQPIYIVSCVPCGETHYFLEYDRCPWFRASAMVLRIRQAAATMGKEPLRSLEHPFQPTEGLEDE